MPETQQINKKERIKLWLKDNYNLALIFILLAGFVIRIYFFSYASGQALWWDEAEYGSMAKHYALGVPFEVSPKRPFMFSGLMSLLFLLDFSEQFIKFFLVLLPSTLLILFIYLLGKEMFNKKVAIISSALAAVSWPLVFWTTRMQPDFLSMCFQVLSILFIWKFFKSRKNSQAFLSGAFASLGFSFKVSGMLVPAVLLIYILLKDRMQAFKTKGYWIFLASFILFYVPQGIYSYYAFGNPLAIFGTDYVTTVTDSQFPFAWYNLKFYYYFTENILFILFILGILLSMRFFIYLDVLFNEKKAPSPEFFSILLFVLVSAYYIFWIKGTDDRWVFLWLPFIFFMIGNACEFTYTFLRKYNKILSFGLIILLLGYGIYSNTSHANALVIVKKDTYSQVRDAAFWLKQNTLPEDIIVTSSGTQTTYYSGRGTISFYDSANLKYYTPEEFDRVIEKIRPKYLVVSVFEPSVPQWTYSYPQRNPESFKPVNAWFTDSEQTQPLLVIYEINYSTSLPTS